MSSEVLGIIVLIGILFLAIRPRKQVEKINRRR